MQVNSTFYSIDKSRVIIHNDSTRGFCLFKWWVQNESGRKLVGTGLQRPQRDGHLCSTCFQTLSAQPLPPSTALGL